MGCCGRKREQLLNSAAPGKPLVSDPPSGRAAFFGLNYRANPPLKPVAAPVAGAQAAAGFLARSPAHPISPPSGHASPNPRPPRPQDGLRPRPALGVPVAPVMHPGAVAARVVNLRYLERSPIRVRGPATGVAYQFSAAQPVQAVDARDAAALLRTRLFTPR